MTSSVSIVLTTYNRGVLLRQTIESVLGQTLGGFELILCDDASTDDTPRICEEYAERDSRVRYIRHSRNCGMPGNLNAGITASTGEYVANLHDGDIYGPTLIEKWKAALDAHPGAAFVFNAYGALTPSGEVRRIYREALPACTPGAVLLEQIFFRRWRFDSPVWGTVMARRSAYVHAGLFDPRFGFVSDVDMWMRLADEYDVAYISEPLINLPCRESVPRKWGGAEECAHVSIDRMFWEARMRHYRDRPIRRFGEAVRHVGFVALRECLRLCFRGI
jgi:glycosyltransferase involved in cell wall biosynthesis